MTLAAVAAETLAHRVWRRRGTGRPQGRAYEEVRCIQCPNPILPPFHPSTLPFFHSSILRPASYRPAFWFALSLPPPFIWSVSIAKAYWRATSFNRSNLPLSPSCPAPIFVFSNRIRFWSFSLRCLATHFAGSQ